MNFGRTKPLLNQPQGSTNKLPREFYEAEGTWYEEFQALDYWDNF